MLREDHLQQIDEVRDDYEQSQSWRLTRPLRELRGRLRGEPS